MNAEIKTINQYIDSQPVGIAAILKKVRETIRNVVPEAEETIQFQLDETIPYDLIAKITTFRVQQNLEKKKK